MNFFLTRLARSVGAWALLVTFTLGVSAQDRRLSHDPIQLDLPESAQFQSAARIGDVTLVAWGSTVLLDDSSMARVIYWQLLRGGVPIGVPRILGSSGARPSTFVAVAALQGSFLVAWNDARVPDSGVYAAAIDTSGTVGEERCIQLGGTFMDGSMRAVTVAGVTRLLWCDSLRARGLYEAVLSNGLPAPGAIALVGTGQPVDVTQMNDGNGMTMVNVVGGAPRFYDRDGGPIPIPDSARSKFNNVYWVHDDGSTLSTQGDTVSIYATPFASAPTRRTVVPRYGTRCILVARLDSARRVHAWSADYSLVMTWYSECRLEVHRWSESPPDSFSGYSLWFESAAYMPANRGRVNAGLRSTTWRRECAGSAYYEAEIGVTIPVDGGTHSWVEKIPMWYNGDSISVVQRSPMRCLGPGAVAVSRRSNRDSSRIRVEVGSGVILSAPAAHRPVNVEDRQPGLRVENGQVVLGWLSHGQDSSAVIARWTHDGGAEITGSLPIDDEHDARPGAHIVKLDDVLYSYSGGFCLVSTARWRTVVDTVSVDSQVVRIAMPDSSGWRTALEIRESDSARELRIHHIVHNTGRDEALFLVGMRKGSIMSRLRAVAVHSSGSVAWSNELFGGSDRPLPMSIIPADSAVFLLAHAGGTTRFDRGTAVRTVAPNQPGTAMIYLTGDAGTYYRSTTGSTVSIQHIDTLGARLADFQAPVFPQARDAFSVVRDPVSGRIAAIAAGRGGVSCTVFSRDGTGLMPVRQISEPVDSAWSPTAVFHGDRLFVAWVDARRGVSDVHGVVVDLDVADAPDTRVFSRKGTEPDLW